MNMKLIRLFFLCMFCSITSLVSGQVIDLDVYKAEVGINGGSSYYIGEANKLLFNNMSIDYGGFLRYKINTRVAFRAELNRATVAGKGIKNNMVYVGDFCGEFNFFDLENNPYKRYSKTFSPYIFTGVSLFTDVYYNQPLPEIGLPFGVGFKVILAKRWNLDFKWSNRLLFADNLEGRSKPDFNNIYNNPEGLNGSNIFNNDLLSTLTIGISYNIWKKECDCLNSSYGSVRKVKKRSK